MVLVVVPLVVEPLVVLLIVLIFLLIGAVSAHDDSNGTADSILKDT